jgi:hypothetical protein
MMKLYTIATVLLLSIMTSIPAVTGVYEPDKLRVHLRMDKKVFYTDEDVVLKVCVQNVSDSKNYFVVYDPASGESSNYTTFQPLVVNLEGRDAEITVPYKKKNININDFIGQLDRRMIELAPGEMFIHSVNLKELFMLDVNMEYRTKGLFYPSFDEDKALKSDNELTFKIIESKRYNKPNEAASVERSITPGEVILLTLRAEKDRDWDNWKKYIDVEKYINAFPEFAQKYSRASYEDKSQIESEFVRYVTRDRDDYLIDYKIVRESVEKGRKFAYVDVIADRYGMRLTFRYKCRYTLEQYKNLWLITDEEATVMKGVKK